MPRKSASETNSPRLSVVPRVPGQGRPAPPSKLSQAASQAWRDIVDAAPDGFLDKGAQQLLKRIVVQIAVAERQEARLEKMARTGASLQDEADVLKMHRDATKTIQAGLTALRATPGARLRPGSAGTAFQAAPGSSKPWDYEDVTDVEGEGEGSGNDRDDQHDDGKGDPAA